ncbi:hypothetical protein [Brevibacillus massiliensis]|uniref:hypothetical protein n=1 Tax=Brevibacillus massiliensis TaxID=1118054 RepID=UPI0002EF74BF|nr:hypothetical protein [Brevibacillus massiliensis]
MTDIANDPELVIKIKEAVERVLNNPLADINMLEEELTRVILEHQKSRPQP